MDTWVAALAKPSFGNRFKTTLFFRPLFFCLTFRKKCSQPDNTSDFRSTDSISYMNRLYPLHPNKTVLPYSHPLLLGSSGLLPFGLRGPAALKSGCLRHTCTRTRQRLRDDRRARCCGPSGRYGCSVGLVSFKHASFRPQMVPWSPGRPSAALAFCSCTRPSTERGLSCMTRHLCVRSLVSGSPRWLALQGAGCFSYSMGENQPPSRRRGSG